MIGHDPEQGTAENYRRFAALEARGRSPLYEELATGVASDPELLAFLESLPRDKRQPNLLLASVRYLTGLLPGYGAFRDTVLDRREEVAAVMLARRTQTNEPARCATLLPALALLPQPLALLEVGASAGLCLLPDRYAYAYGTHRVDGHPDSPVLACQTRGPVPLPARSPQVVWRAGIDLNPLDVTDPDDMHWLSCLVWPGEGERAGRLAAAIGMAREDPPRIVRGDLVDQLAETAAQAPPAATLVVFHSAVLAYLTPERRTEFAEAVGAVGAVWLSNEAPRVLSHLPGFPAELPAPDPGPSPFLLTRDGREALAFTDGHGAWIRWLA
ncbi:MAG TPA: DUF2332 domain-containing protein [Streptosporangiaceae bacterium]|nr:DUF2332 domain-containing protein [Streptosporangiaceae bacterium]